MGLAFAKLTGAGNDFVVFNNMDGHLTQDQMRRREFVARVCARGTGVGADGVLMVEPSAMGVFRMRYYNADGGEVETCGNGARCIARFAYLEGVAGESMRFETNAGMYEAMVRPEAVTVSMSDAHSLQLDIAMDLPGLYSGCVDFVNTGVPHVVIQAVDLEGTRVFDCGRAIRRHIRFDPPGTNVNFLSPLGPDHFTIRTYERGVEDETLACGTGCIAGAIIAARRGLARSPVRLTTRSGVDLVVHFEQTNNGAREVRLEGEARVVFRGELSEEMSRF